MWCLKKPKGGVIYCHGGRKSMRDIGRYFDNSPAMVLLPDGYGFFDFGWHFFVYYLGGNRVGFCVFWDKEKPGKLKKR